MNLWGKSILGRGNNRYKGPRAGINLYVKDELEGQCGWHIVSMERTLDFVLSVMGNHWGLFTKGENGSDLCSHHMKKADSSRAQGEADDN